MLRCYPANARQTLIHWFSFYSKVYFSSLTFFILFVNYSFLLIYISGYAKNRRKRVKKYISGKHEVGSVSLDINSLFPVDIQPEKYHISCVGSY